MSLKVTLHALSLFFLMSCTSARYPGVLDQRVEVTERQIRVEARALNLGLKARRRRGLTTFGLGPRPPVALAWSQDGARIAAVSDGWLGVWSVEGAPELKISLDQQRQRLHQAHGPGNALSQIFWIEGGAALFINIWNPQLLQWRVGESKLRPILPQKLFSWFMTIRRDGAQLVARGNYARSIHFFTYTEGAWRRAPSSLSGDHPWEAATYTLDGRLIMHVKGLLYILRPGAPRFADWLPVARFPKGQDWEQADRLLVGPRGEHVFAQLGSKIVWWSLGSLKAMTWLGEIEGVLVGGLERRGPDGALHAGLLTLREGALRWETLAQLKGDPPTLKAKIYARGVRFAAVAPDAQRFALATRRGVEIQDAQGRRLLGALPMRAEEEIVTQTYGDDRQQSWVMGESRLPSLAANQRRLDSHIIEFEDEADFSFDLLVGWGARAYEDLTTWAMDATLRFNWRLKDEGGDEMTPSRRHERHLGVDLGLDVEDTEESNLIGMRLGLPLTYRTGISARMKRRRYVDGRPFDLTLTPSVIIPRGDLDLTLSARIREFGGIYARAGYASRLDAPYTELGLSLGNGFSPFVILPGLLVSILLSALL